MDSYIEVVLQVLLLDHDRRYLPKAWGYSEEPRSIRRRHTIKMLNITLSQPSNLESDMTLIVFASLVLFRLLKTFFLLCTFSKFYRQIPSCWEFIGLPNLQEMLCLKSCEPCETPSGSPQPHKGQGLSYGWGRRAAICQWAIFDSQSKASKKKVRMQDFLPYGGIVIWPFPQQYLIKQKWKQKGGRSSVQISPQSSSSFEEQLIAGTWKTPSEQKEAARIQVLEDRALSNSKVFSRSCTLWTWFLSGKCYRETGLVL